MDELVIEDKKYISTKRAAQSTGYAKDYIGQLCREGRVPARLVGRSWYVLESAIHDHRFDSPREAEHTSMQNEEKRPLLSSTWESPRYEAIPFDRLPSVNRLKESIPSVRDENAFDSLDKIDKTTPTIHEVWREWFERVGDDSSNVVAETAQKEELAAPQKDAQEEIVDTENEVGSMVTVHTLQQREPEHKVSHRLGRVRPKQSPLVVLISAYAFALLALLFASSAVISSGILDDHSDSLQQASIITGISIYRGAK